MQEILKRRDQRASLEATGPTGGRGRGGRGRGGRGRGCTAVMKRPAAAKSTAPTGESAPSIPEPKPKRRCKALDAQDDPVPKQPKRMSETKDASKEPPKKTSRASRTGEEEAGTLARKTFAKRSCPASEGPTREKWLGLKEVFESQLAPKFRFPTKYEDCCRAHLSH